MPRPLGLRPRTIVLLVITCYSAIFAVIAALTGKWDAAYGWASSSLMAGLLVHDGLRLRELHDDIGEVTHGPRWVRSTVRTPAFLPPVSHQCAACRDIIEVDDPRHLAEVVEYHDKVSCTANRAQP